MVQAGDVTQERLGRSRCPGGGRSRRPSRSLDLMAALRAAQVFSIPSINASACHASPWVALLLLIAPSPPALPQFNTLRDIPW